MKTQVGRIRIINHQTTTKSKLSISEKGGDMHRLFRYPILMIGIAAITACANLPELRDTNSYAYLNCQELQQEQTALRTRIEHADSEQGLGFVDFLGALTTGLASSVGRNDIVQQQDQLNQSRANRLDKLAADGQAYQNRDILISKIRALKQC